MRPKCSAYLSIYNDWDILPDALASVRPYIDELIVVDGAYNWMADYLSEIGRDPIRSDKRVYDIIGELDLPVRFINQLWHNEIDKRIAGYNACSHNYVFRIDADEVFFFDDLALNDFFERDEAVGQMSMPLYFAPGLVLDKVDWKSKQSFLFNKMKIDADVHLNYLWLILPADSLPLAGQKPFNVFERPLAFNAHLSNWRTPETSTNRSAFYNINYFRAHGVPWIKDLAGAPIGEVNRLFHYLSPMQFRDIIINSSMVIGECRIKEGMSLFPTPLTQSQEGLFVACYKKYLKSLGELNMTLVTRGRQCLAGSTIMMDMSSEEARQTVCRDNSVTLSTSGAISIAKGRLIRNFNGEPWYNIEELEIDVVDRRAAIRLPSNVNSDFYIRQILELQLWFADKEKIIHSFKVQT